MTARCRVCSHEQRHEIERRLVASQPPNFSAIGRLFDLDHEAIARHARSHLPAALVKAAEIDEVASADWIVRIVKDGLAELDGVVARSRAKGDERTVVAAVKAKSTLVNCVTSAAHVILEERRLQSTECQPEKRLTVTEIQAIMKANTEREIARRLATMTGQAAANGAGEGPAQGSAQGQGPGAQGSGVTNNGPGVRPPGHLDAFPDSAEAV